jgi:uncharacterized protein YlxW (UPF0749 family)
MDNPFSHVAEINATLTQAYDLTSSIPFNTNSYQRTMDEMEELQKENNELRNKVQELEERLKKYTNGYNLYINLKQQYIRLMGKRQSQNIYNCI